MNYYYCFSSDSASEHFNMDFSAIQMNFYHYYYPSGTCKLCNDSNVNNYYREEQQIKPLYAHTPINVIYAV